MFALLALVLAALPQSVPAQDEAFRRVADDFIAAAAAGETAKAALMISPATAAKTGKEGVEHYLASQVLPFFAQLKEVARAVTVAPTAKVTGFAYYMHMVSKVGQYRPFVIFVVEEGGAKVVANVTVDSFIEGRHCAHVGEGWKCPKFQ
jgi:hypothetical protein